jgi:hypothetical protein
MEKSLQLVGHNSNLKKIIEENHKQHIFFENHSRNITKKYKNERKFMTTSVKQVIAGVEPLRLRYFMLNERYTLFQPFLEVPLYYPKNWQLYRHFAPQK